MQNRAALPVSLNQAGTLLYLFDMSSYSATDLSITI